MQRAGISLTMIYALSAITALIIICFLLRKKKGAELVPDQQVQEGTRPLLQEHVAFYRRLDTVAQEKFLVMTEEFLRDIHIEGVGTEISVKDKVLIASSAVIPVFYFPGWRYTNLTNVILYPDTFNSGFKFEGDDRNVLGMVGSGYMNGQMLLSRTALEKGFSASGGKDNAAVHEFVHLVDMTDGVTDGVPGVVLAEESTRPWLRMMHAEMKRIERGHSDINPYALTNEAEFLAVAAEYFFGKPEQFAHKHPELYQELNTIFNQTKPAAGNTEM